MERKRILVYLSYYFEPDLSAGSFRNSSLAEELSKIVDSDVEIHLIATIPNRYSGMNKEVLLFEQKGRLYIHRIPVDQHGNRFLFQIWSFIQYQSGVLKVVKSFPIHSIFASSSKLFTAHLAYRLSKKTKAPYYLDVRDLFTENLKELIRIPFLNRIIPWILKIVFEKPTFENAKHININSNGFRANMPEGMQEHLSFFPNGIDDDFLVEEITETENKKEKVICYAGNIGTGQGLDKIVPFVAKELSDSHIFWIIGSGSTKAQLEQKIQEENIKNVFLFKPVARKELIQFYQKADYLFLHLNNFKSFEKVIPSKLFEYGAMTKPILAGVGGYTRQFIQENLKDNYYIFDPCDGKGLVEYLKNDKYKCGKREKFIEQFSRKQIAVQMALSIKRNLEL